MHRIIRVSSSGFEPSSVFLIEYSTKKRDPDEFHQGHAVRADVVFELAGNSYKAQVALPYCRYTFLCRQVR